MFTLSNSAKIVDSTDNPVSDLVTWCLFTSHIPWREPVLLFLFGSISSAFIMDLNA